MTVNPKQCAPTKSTENLDELALAVYTSSLGSRGSTEEKRTFPDDPDENTQHIIEDSDWYWNIEKKTYSLTYQNKEGLEQTLYGYFLRNGTSNRTAVVVHGWTGCARQMGSMAKVYYDLGYNIFTPDLRGHGRSTENNINYGAIDSGDLINWLMLLNEAEGASGNFKADLFGISMGALVVLGAAAKDNFPSFVESIVIDSGFDNALLVLLSEIIASPVLSSLNAVEQAYVVYKINSLFEQKQGVGFFDLLTPEKVKLNKLPVLTINGSKDNPGFNVPLNIFNETRSFQKMYWIVDGGGHANCQNFVYDEYNNKIRQFLETRESNPLMSLVNSRSVPLFGDVGKDALISALKLKVTDSVDGDISGTVNIAGVDFNTNGIYTATLTCTNSRQNTTAYSVDVAINRDSPVTAGDYTLGAKSYSCIINGGSKSSVMSIYLAKDYNEGSEQLVTGVIDDDWVCHFDIQEGFINSVNDNITLFIFMRDWTYFIQPVNIIS